MGKLAKIQLQAITQNKVNANEIKKYGAKS